MTDDLDLHELVSTGVATNKNKVIVSYAGNFKTKEHQYFTMAKLRFLSDKDADKFRSKAEQLHKTSPEPPPLVFRNHEEDKLHDVLIFDVEEDHMEEPNERKDVFDIYVGLPSEGGSLFMKEVTMKVVDVPRFDHYDPLATAYTPSSVHTSCTATKTMRSSHTFPPRTRISNRFIHFSVYGQMLIFVQVLELFCKD